MIEKIGIGYDIHRLVKNESLRRRYSDEYKHLLHKYNLNEE